MKRQDNPVEHSIDFIVDGRKIRTQGKSVVLRVDGKSICKYPGRERSSSEDGRDITVSTMRALLMVAMASFGNKNRFEIVNSLSKSPKTFSEVKEMLELSSPAVNHHLKKLAKELVIFKDTDGRYSLTTLGDMVLEYFSKLLKEMRDLQGIIETTCAN